MKKIVMLFGIVLLLTGCAKPIELSEENQDIIADYTADIVLKFDVNSELALSYESDKQEQEKTPIDEVPNAEAEQEETSNGDDSQEQLPAESEVHTLQELITALGLEDFDISYDGYSVLDNYNMDNSNTYDISAGVGSKLAVLRFILTNKTAETKMCDVLSKNPKFSISVNGGNMLPSMMTALPNDLLVFTEEIAGNQTSDTILIVQIPADLENGIQSISLSAIYNGNTFSVQLQ